MYFKTSVNKVGFILQLGYFLVTKKFYEKQVFPEADVQNVSIRIGLKQIANLNDYAQTTLLRHRKIILERLGYHAFSEVYLRLLSMQTDFLLSKQVRLKDAFDSLIRLLEQKRVEVPSYNILSHVITDAFRRYQKEIVARIERVLTREDMVLLDTLLAVDETYETTESQGVKLKRYKITMLKETKQAVRPSRIQENLAHLHILKDYFQKLQPAIQAL